jgi:hypothetical protein
MKALQAAGFFGRGLVPVVEPAMVARYNACLQALGLEPTALTRFALDGLGWSPQVAKEKENPDYLSHGESNLYAIILTPEQQGRPVYRPMHSFDRAILGEVFRQGREVLYNLTAETGVCLDINQGIDHYRSPLDLLMVDSFTIRAFTPTKLMVNARRQRALVSRFREEPEAWQDEALLADLVESARRFGDLRTKRLILPDIPFSAIANFHTRALGGVFVFRSAPKGRVPIVVMEDADRFGGLEDSGRRIFSLRHKQGVLEALSAAGLITHGWAQADFAPRVERILRELAVDAVYEGSCDKPFHELTSAQQKRWLFASEPLRSPAHAELEELLRDLRSGRPVRHRKLGDEAWTLLFKPTAELGEETEAVLWRLLNHFSPTNLEALYRHSKDLFYRHYETWPEPRRQWALHYLKSLNLPHED